MVSLSTAQIKSTPPCYMLAVILLHPDTN